MHTKQLPNVHICRRRPNRMWASRFMWKWGIDTWVCNTAGTYLSENHPSMVRWQDMWKTQHDIAHAPLTLRMSYDKLWKNRYRAPKRSMRRQRARLGTCREDRRADPAYMAQNRSLKSKVDEAHSHSDGQEYNVRTSMVEDARCGMIQDYRKVMHARHFHIREWHKGNPRSSVCRWPVPCTTHGGIQHYVSWEALPCELGVLDALHKRRRHARLPASCCQTLTEAPTREK